MPVCPPTSRSGCSSGSKLVLLEPNPPPSLALLPRVLRLRLPHLPDLPLQHLLRDLPLRRVRIRAPRMNRVHTHIQNVPAAEAA